MLSFDEILRQVEEKNLTKQPKVQRVFTETKKFTLIQKTPSKEEQAAAAAVSLPVVSRAQRSLRTRDRMLGGEGAASEGGGGQGGEREEGG